MTKTTHSKQDIENYLLRLIETVAYNSHILLQNDMWDIREYIKSNEAFISKQLFNALVDFKRMKGKVSSQAVEEYLAFVVFQLIKIPLGDARLYVRKWRKALTDELCANLNKQHPDLDF